MSIRIPFFVFLFAAGLIFSEAGRSDTISRGAVLSASCEGCHGTGGRSPGAIPPISGKSIDYLVAALEGFRSGERQSTVMGRHVKGYGEDEIRLIAAYFASQD